MNDIIPRAVIASGTPMQWDVNSTLDQSAGLFNPMYSVTVTNSFGINSRCGCTVCAENFIQVSADRASQIAVIQA